MLGGPAPPSERTTRTELVLGSHGRRERAGLWPQGTFWKRRNFKKINELGSSSALEKKPEES